MQLVTNVKRIDKEKWNEFVLFHPNGNIFQTPNIVQVYEKTKNYYPIVVIVVEGNDIVGVLIGVIEKEYKGFLGYLTSRCIIDGGPLAKNDNLTIIDLLIREFKRIVKNKSIYIQFRNLFSLKHHKTIFSKNGFLYQAHLDIHIDLTQKADCYWHSLKSKLRQNIRKANKSNIIFEQVHSKDKIFEAYNILKEVYKKAKLPISDISLFLNIFDDFYDKNYIAFFVAKKGEEIIGVRFVFLYRHLIYDWYAGSKIEYYRYNVNDFLPYKVIEWGIKHPEFKKFDFGGAGKPNIYYGVRNHKMKFGGEFVEYGRYICINKPFFYQIGKIGLKILRELKKI